MSSPSPGTSTTSTQSQAARYRFHPGQHRQSRSTHVSSPPRPGAALLPLSLAPGRRGIPRCHRANKRSRIAGMPLHANPIAQDGTARIRARRIDRDNANLLLPLAVIGRQTVDQCALSSSRRASDARQIGLTRMRKQQPQQRLRFRLVIFDRRDRARNARTSPARTLSAHFSTGRVILSCGAFWSGQSHLLLFLAEELPGNHQLLNFAGALADSAELHVAIILLRGIILDEAVAAMNLHALVGHLHAISLANSLPCSIRG